MATTEERTRERERDLILAPNSFAFILDSTKGQISTYVGPQKTSLSTTDQPVVFNEKTKKFDRCTLEEAIQLIPIAPTGFYLVIKNPEATSNVHPRSGTTQQTPELAIGRKINIPGPVSFALWPGQMAKILKGHNLRSNQYLLVRVYDEEAARKNWKSAVVKPQVTTNGDVDPISMEPPPDIVMGKLFVIKGTDVSFYIPPTGVEVVADNEAPGKPLVRDAVTLEKLEYCLLLDQDGNKRYVQGPAVVFPKPTEEFVSKNVSKKDTEKVVIRKFRAIELNENSGIYVKVISDYEEDGVVHKIGDELFITGKDQMIYFPREEHAIVKYGTQEIHYGIAIPSGEARYVLDRNTGNIRLVSGPTVFLADPRHEVIVHRILEPKLCELMYPGNAEAFNHNVALLSANGDGGATYSAAASASDDDDASASRMVETGYVLPEAQMMKRVTLRSAVSRGFSGDSFERTNKYTKPRTITLNTKYDGAVSMDVWTGYAVKLVKKTGESRVVVGPQTVLLEYDEQPQIISMSRGKPKSTNDKIRTTYLRVSANKVSDIVHVETKDLCRLSVELSYRLNFEGDSSKWFDVEDYVKFLVDNMRSKIRNSVMTMGIEQFYSTSTDVVRDVVLGKQTAAGRLGATFFENGMHVYDVEVVNVKMVDAEVEKSFVQAQREVISQTLILAARRRSLEHSREIESINRERMNIEHETRQRDVEIKTIDVLSKAELDRTMEVAAASLLKQKRTSESENQDLVNEIETKKLESFRLDKETKLALEKKLLDQKIEEMRAETESMKEKASAISPDFIAALQAFGDKALIEKVSAAMGPLAILGGEDVVGVLRKLLAGTQLESYLKPIQQK